MNFTLNCLSCEIHYPGRFLVTCWSILALFMNLFYNNELRTHLIGQEFETPLQTLEDVDFARNTFIIIGA